MKVRNFLHKGLKRLYDEGNGKGVPADTIDKISKMFAFIDGMSNESELSSLPSWKAHTLVGNRKGIWSLSVTRNKRLTFFVNGENREICDMDLEDYH